MAPVEEMASEAVGVEMGLGGSVVVEMKFVREGVSDHGLIRLPIVEGVSTARGGGKHPWDAEDVAMKTS